MREGQLLVRGLSGWVLGKRLGELRWLDNYSLLVVLSQFDLNLVANFDAKPPEQILAEAEIALTAVDREPGSIFDAIDMGKHRRPLATEGCRDLLGN